MAEVPPAPVHAAGPVHAAPPRHATAVHLEGAPGEPAHRVNASTPLLSARAASLSRRERAQGSVSDGEHATILVCSDFLAACMAVPLSLLLLAVVSGAHVNAMSQYAHNCAQEALFPVAVVLALAASGMYRSARRALQPSTFTEMKDLVLAIGAGGILFLALGAVSHLLFDTTEFVVSQLLVAVLVGSVTIVLGRALVRAVIATHSSTRVMIVGSGALEERIRTYLGLHRGMEVIGRVVDADQPDDGSLGTVADLPDLCTSWSIDRLIIGFPGRDALESVATYRSLLESVHIAVVPRYFELISWRSRMTELCGMPMLEVAAPNLSAWDRVVKRAFDLVLAGLVLVVLSPLLVVVALLVKGTSSGPALFRQDRVGRGRQLFSICKFRTMATAAGQDGMTGSAGSDGSDGSDAGDVAQAPVRGAGAAALHELRGKAAERPRVTRIGGFLRRTSLDELPQLLNVLRGDMSIVGPRPFVPRESEYEGLSSRRFDVRPGITGLWQVSGRNDLRAEDLRQLDYLYVVSWSMWSDLKIIWETPRTMVRGLGAY